MSAPDARPSSKARLLVPLALVAAALVAVRAAGIGRRADPAAPDAPSPTAAADEPGGLRGGVLVREPGALDGYVILAPIKSRDVHLLDMDGEPVHSWRTTHPFGMTVSLLADGHLMRGARDTEGNPRFHGGGLGGRLQRLDWDGNLVWDYVLPDPDLMPHHDLEVMPNGNVLVVAWEYLPPEAAIAAGRASEAVGSEGLWPDTVLEIRPVPPDGGEIVWRWRAWDHLVQDVDPEKPNHGDPAAHPGRIDVNADHRHADERTPEQLAAHAELERQMRAIGYVGGEDEPGADDGGPAAHDADLELKRADWLHINTVSYSPELDLIALSTPRLHELWVIDHSTTTEEAAGSTGGRYGRGGDLLYRWGNPRAYGLGGAEDQRMFFQHQPEWLQRDDGSWALLVFNNGRDRPGNFSSVEELVLPFDPAAGFHRPEGEPFGPEGPVWTHELHGPYFSAVISGAHRLPNGNTFICCGIPGRLLEVTPEGEVVWEYQYRGEPDSTRLARDIKIPPRALFRATKIPADDPRLAGKL